MIWGAVNTGLVASRFTVSGQRGECGSQCSPDELYFIIFFIRMPPSSAKRVLAAISDFFIKWAGIKRGEFYVVKK